jgi:hypothetical protein
VFGQTVKAALLIGILFLAGCSSGSSKPVAITLSTGATQAMDQGQTVNIAATVTNDKANAGVGWTLTSGPGALTSPTTTGVTYSANGAVGTAVITATSVTDATKTATLTITITAVPAITTNSLPAGTEGAAYSQSIAKTGGAGTLAFTVSAGTLPAGLTLSTSGTISGTPTGPNTTANFTIKVTDGSTVTPQTATQALSIVINLPAAPAITTTTLPADTEGTAYSQQIAATGLAPLTFTNTVGTLPPGLTMSAAGLISGSATGPNGTSPFTVKVTDSSNPTQSATQALSIAVNLPPAPAITTTTLPAGTEGSSYSQQLAATGYGKLTYSVSVGTLPAGLTMSATGLISGTPTGPNGTSPFTIKVTDSSNPVQSTTQALSIVINLPAPPSISTTTLPAGVEGTAYSQTVSATGGLGTLTFSISLGSLPAGLTISSSGTISGTPTGPNGTIPFTVQVADKSTPAQTATKALSILINLPAAPTITPTTLPNGTVGTAYSQTLTVAHGLSPYTWNVSAGALPAGLGLTYNGTTATISGTPTTVQSNVAFTIEVVDSSNPAQNGTQPFTVSIAPAQPLAVTSTSSQIPNATIGTAYTTSTPLATLTASGGVPPYSWVATPVTGILPDGLTLNASGQIIGTVAADAVTESFTVKVTDSATPADSATSASLTITILSAGAHNSYLSGRYVCLSEGFKDSDQSRWADISSIVLDGNGNITSGSWDTNGTDFSIGALHGTLTGTYSVGTDDVGTLTSVAGIVTNQWAIALSNVAGPVAQQFRRVEIGDAGSSPSGQHGTGNCYLATTGAFTSSTLNGNSFVWNFRGEDSAKIPSASVGRLSASSGSYTNCYIDYADGSDQVESDTCTGTYTAPDSTTGRLTATFTPAGSSARNWVVYIIDANRAVMLNITAQEGTEAGELRKQQQSSYSNANLTGPFVLYMQGFDFTGTSVSGLYTKVLQGTGNGTSGATMNASFANDSGTYKVDHGLGAVTVTFDSSHPGRATVAANGGTGYLYFYGTNLAAEISPGNAEWGWIEAQTQTTFTFASQAGSYMFGKIPLIDEGGHGNVGVVALDSNGNIAGSSTTAGQGYLTSDQPLSATYVWDSTTYGTALVTSSHGDSSCMVVSSTEFVCISSTDTSPSISIFQK